MAPWQESMTSFLKTARQPLVVVLGPTASGKTGFSLRLASELREVGHSPAVINADSRQLYRHLDIGTAKVGQSERGDVPHHLLDVLDPRDAVSVAWYKEHALQAIDRVQEQGGVPLLVGGSMLYISSIIDGLEPLPAVDPSIRRRLEEEYDVDAGAVLYARLQEADPAVAASIEPKNKRYLVRAVELLEQTGKTISEQRRTTACPYELFIVGMQWDRDELVRRINARTGDLFSQGWVEEVERLRTMGYAAGDPGMQSHGYREVLAWIEDGKAEEMKNDLQERIAANTRQYAKRQMTWWNADPRIRWIPSSALG